MKKVIVFIFLLISSLGFFYAEEEVSYAFDTDLTIKSITNHKNVPFIIYFNENLPESNNFTNTLIEIAQANNISIYKSIPSNNEYLIQGLYYLSDNIFQDAGLELTKEDLIKFNQANDIFISNNKKLSFIGSFPNIQTDITYQYQSLINNKDCDGYYAFIGDNSEKAFSQLRTHYPSLEIVPSPSNENDFPHQISESTINLYITHCILLGTTIVTLLLIYISSKEKEIAIKKLNGFHTTRILFQEMLDLCYRVILYNLLLYTLLIIFKYGFTYSIYILTLLKFMLIFMLAQLIIIVISSIFMICYFHSVPIVSIIKNKDSRNIMFSLNMVLRLFVFLFSISIISSNIPTLLKQGKNIIQYSSFQQNINNLVYLQPSNHDVSSDNAFSYVSTLNKALRDMGAIGIQTNLYEKDSNEIPIIEIDYNFFKQSNLKNENGDEFHLEEISENQIYSLVPKSVYQKQKEKIDQYYEKIQNSSIILIEDDQRLFTYDNTINESGLGYAKNAIIEVSSFINPWYMYIQEDQLDKDHIEKTLIANGFSPELTYQLLSDQSDFNYNLQKNSFMQSLKFILLDLFALFAIIFQLFTLYEKVNKKEIAIYRINGYSILRSYCDLFYIQCLFYIILYFLALLFKYNLSIFWAIFLLMILEAMITCIFLIVNSKKPLIVNLKE